MFVSPLIAIQLLVENNANFLLHKRSSTYRHPDHPDEKCKQTRLVQLAANPVTEISGVMALSLSDCEVSTFLRRDHWLSLGVLILSAQLSRNYERMLGVND